MTTILSVDPGLTTGVALVQADERWEPSLLGHWTLKLNRPWTGTLPALARGNVPINAGVIWEACQPVLAPVDGFWTMDWHWVCERQFVGGSSHPGSAQEDTCLQVTWLSGQLYQAIARCVPSTASWPLAIHWRTVLGPRGGNLPSKSAHAAAIALVESRFGQTLPEHEAEATCMALWRLEGLRKEATDARIREVAGTQQTLPVAKQAKRGKRKLGLESLPQSVQDAADRAHEELKL